MKMPHKIPRGKFEIRVKSNKSQNDRTMTSTRQVWNWPPKRQIVELSEKNKIKNKPRGK